MDAARKLMLLAADIEPEADPILWDVLREGTERRWGVTRDVGKTLSEALLEIVVQLGDEQGRDAESVELVREHGGPRNAGAKLYLATEVAKAVTGREHGISTPNALLEELRRRLMPEGYEWPRYESGELVEVGDEFMERGGVRNVVHCVAVGIDWFEVYGFDGASSRYSKGERVRRPSVLASDGEPLEVGQTVWNEVGVGFKVEEVNTKNSSFTAIRDFDESRCDGLNPMAFTHQRPVLDADGVPIKKGDTVWHKGTGEKYRVFRFSDEEDRVWGESDLGSFFLDCSMLTHTKPEPPDSWERIEEDAERIDETRQWGDRTPDVRDLVRRCRALAERERGEK